MWNWSFCGILRPLLKYSKMQGWKLQNISAFPSEKCRKNLPVRLYFCLSWTSRQRVISKKFSLSLGKVSKILTCPVLFLPVPDRRTACNFHPCIWPVMSRKQRLSMQFQNKVIIPVYHIKACLLYSLNFEAFCKKMSFKIFVIVRPKEG